MWIWIPPPPPNFFTVGASHMCAITANIEAKGYRAGGVAVSGWTANAKNLAELNRIIAAECTDPNTVVVLDLFSNTVTRYRQADDSTALAVKQQGGWHMPGEVVYSPDAELEAMVEKTVPLLLSIPNRKILLPPLPRYTFGGCCDDPLHAPNTRMPEFAPHALKEHLRMRALIKKLITSRRIPNTRILDALGSMTPDHLTPHQKLALLSKLTHKDNVHYTQAAYGKLAEKVISEAHSGTATAAAAAPVRSAAQLRQVRWRGFVTTPGVGKTSNPVPAGGVHSQRRGFGCKTAFETGSGSDAGSSTGTSNGAGFGTRSLSYQRQFHPYRR